MKTKEEKDLMRLFGEAMGYDYNQKFREIGEEEE